MRSRISDIIGLGRRANTVAALLVIVTITVATYVSLQAVLDSPSQETNEYKTFSDKFDKAENVIFESMKGSILLAIRDYLLNGYSKNSSLWLENVQLVPKDAERLHALKLYVNESLEERFDTIFLEHPEFSTDSFVLNDSEMGADFIPRTYTDRLGNTYDGYEIFIDHIKLETPYGHRYYNYTFSAPNIWIIYGRMKGYVESGETHTLFDSLAQETENDICNDVYCQCGSAPMPSADNDITVNFISEEDVRPFFASYLRGLENHVEELGFECSFDLFLDVDNAVSREVIVSGEKEGCPDTFPSATHSRSPYTLAVWSPETATYPGEPLPYQVPSSTYYSYDLFDGLGRDSGLNSGDLGSWPVDLKSHGQPDSSDEQGTDDRKRTQIIYHRLWRGVASLTSFYCEDPTYIVMGGNPKEPTKLDYLRSLIKLRTNTLSTCPVPTEAQNPEWNPWDPAIENACPINCWETYCDPGNPDGSECVPDDDDPDGPDPTKDPCGAQTTVTIDCSKTGEYDCITSSHMGCSEPDPCNLTDCSDCSGCSMRMGSCTSDDTCSCLTTVGDKLEAEEEDCNIVKQCEGGQTICTCSCFPAGTPISMADGTTKPIEDVRVGDQVLSYDVETDRFVNETVLALESPIRGGYYEIRFHGGTLNVTNEHPLYARQEGYEGWAAIEPHALFMSHGMDAVPLDVGDEVFTEKLGWQEVKHIEYVEGAVKTYNLATISNTNTFFAGGVLAHNKPSCFPAGTMIDMADGTQKAIEHVKIGDRVVTYDLASESVSSSEVISYERPFRRMQYTITFHDGSQVRVTDEHPFYGQKDGGFEGWLSINSSFTADVYGSIGNNDVRDIEVGDQLYDRDGGWRKIETISCVDIGFRAYDLNTLTDHTFFADGLLVHNANNKNPQGPGDSDAADPPEPDDPFDDD